MDLASLIAKTKAGQQGVEPLYKELGKNVARVRESKGMTQADLAQALGKGGSTVAEIETGATRILVADVEKIAQALGVQPRMLMQGIWW